MHMPKQRQMKMQTFAHDHIHMQMRACMYRCSHIPPCTSALHTGTSWDVHASACARKWCRRSAIVIKMACSVFAEHIKLMPRHLKTWWEDMSMIWAVAYLYLMIQGIRSQQSGPMMLGRPQYAAHIHCWLSSWIAHYMSAALPTKSLSNAEKADLYACSCSRWDCNWTAAG